MRIKMIATLATAEECRRSGCEYDVAEAIAAEYIAKGLATAVEAKPQPEAKAAKPAKPTPVKMTRIPSTPVENL